MSACTGIIFRRRLRLVSRVRAGVGRDTMIQPLDEGLHPVVPLGSCPRTLHARDQHSPQMILAEEFLLVFSQFGRGHGLMAAVEHQPRNLLFRQFRSQIGSTLLRREPPVLVGIQRVIAVQILERIAILRQQLHARLRRIAQRRPLLLRHQHKRIHLLLRPFLSVARHQAYQHPAYDHHITYS